MPRPRRRSLDKLPEGLEIHLLISEAYDIRKEYLKIIEADKPRKYARDFDGEYTPNMIVPHERAPSVLRRRIYRLALFINYHKLEFAVERVVRAICRRHGKIIRPRKPNAVDWSIRLVRHLGQGLEWLMTDRRERNAGPLFDDMTQTRLLTELRFAFNLRLDPELCTAVIDEVGGYEFIRAVPEEMVFALDWAERAAWDKEKYPISLKHSIKIDGISISFRVSAPFGDSDTIPAKIRPALEAYTDVVATMAVNDIINGRSHKAYLDLEYFKQKLERMFESGKKK